MIFTPLERAILSAYDFSAGLAAIAMIQDLLRQGEDASLGVTDRSLPIEIRQEAMKDVRHVNTTLVLLATVQEAQGISA
jgi:hypothetical protein